MNATEIMAKLDELNIGPEQMYNDEEGYSSYSLDGGDVTDTLINSGIGGYKKVDSKGGNEGGGEEFYRVYHFTDHNVYLKTVDAYYYSYDEVNFDGATFKQVFPKERRVIVYE